MILRNCVEDSYWDKRMGEYGSFGKLEDSVSA